MGFIPSLIALFVLMAIGVYGYWFAFKDAISIYPRKKKQPTDRETPDLNNPPSAHQ